jgi:hypothetical protein
MHELETITELYHGAWNDFLSNKRQSAITRAGATLKRIQHVEELGHLDAETRKDLLITKADLLYIKGASQGDNTDTLSQALGTYEQYLKVRASQGVMRFCYPCPLPNALNLPAGARVKECHSHEGRNAA